MTPYYCSVNFPSRSEYIFFAPEIINKQISIEKIGYPADIYAFGVTMLFAFLKPRRFYTDLSTLIWI